MKNLETFTGGHPLTIDDLKHMQTGYTELFQMLGALGSQDGSPRVVTGCVISGSIPTRSVSAGWLWWNGEFYHVPAATISGANPHIVGYPQVSYLPPSPVVYADTTVRNCHRYAYMQVLSTSSPGLPTLAYLATIPKWGLEPWVNATGFGSGYANDPTGNYQSISHRKSLGGYIELRGAIKTTAIPGGTLAFTLPAGSRPTKTLRFTTSTNSAPAYIDINQLGEVHVFPQVMASAMTIFFDGVRFDLT